MSGLHTNHASVVAPHVIATHFRLGRVIVAATAVAAIAALGIGLAASQAQDRDNDEQLFQLRTEIAARFVSTYATQLLARERVAAEAELSSSPPNLSAFAAVNTTFGFGAVVLLDGRGDLLAVEPPAPKLIGVNLSSRYPHLAAAVGGRSAVSNLALSASLSLPVVAFAIPYATSTGRRVYSGAFEVADTPLGAYLSNAITYAGSHAFLIDSDGNIVTSNPTVSESTIHTLASTNPQLARALANVKAGTLPEPQPTYFAIQPVAGTPWRVVATVPDTSLFSAQSGTSVWVPWVLFTAFGVGLLVGLIFLFRYLDGRDRLAHLNLELANVARIDSLTNIHNRRHLEEQLNSLLSAARRERRSLGVLLIDLDHFKKVNDSAGHAAGDRALQETARRLREVVRAEDVLGRWGGEEFLVIAPGSDAVSAVILAERLRAEMERSEIDLGGVSLALTLSIGVAAGVDVSPDQLLRGADAALYRAKLEGRNRVIDASSSFSHAMA